MVLITERVGEKYRRRATAAPVLAELIDVALSERRDLLADIWATNQGSIALHEKSGFQLISVSTERPKSFEGIYCRRNSPKANGSVMTGAVRMPKVSVITAAYNHVSFIRQSVKSVQAQTFRDFEHIVVDDGSSDGTAEILESFGSQINYIRQENRGARRDQRRYQKVLGRIHRDR